MFKEKTGLYNSHFIIRTGSPPFQRRLFLLTLLKEPPQNATAGPPQGFGPALQLPSDMTNQDRDYNSEEAGGAPTAGHLSSASPAFCRLVQMPHTSTAPATAAPVTPPTTPAIRPTFVPPDGGAAGPGAGAGAVLGMQTQLRL
jgi:hypothetical protein